MNIEVIQLDVNTDNQAVLKVKWQYWPNQTLKPITEIKNFTYNAKHKTQESKVEAQSQTIAAFSEHVINSLLAVLK